MEVVFDKGVYLPELDLWLDSLRKREQGFISHAHSDHTARHNRPILTPNTGLLLRSYLKKSNPITLAYGEALQTERYTLELHPAGHCLGSAQVLAESRRTGERVLYTGDFKPRPSPINEPLRAVPCDTLIIEATYGQPQYAFPDEKQTLATAGRVLGMWLSRGERPVVQGWRLGKSQEILWHLLSMGFEVAVEESIYGVVEAYQEAGAQFSGAFRRLDGQWREGEVLLTPPGQAARRLQEGVRGKRYMELTGWAAGGRHPWGRRNDVSLPYSDHADFNELVTYVKQVNPQRVYTVNGFPDLAAHLRKLGYPAAHLDGQRPALLETATAAQGRLL